MEAESGQATCTLSRIKRGFDPSLETRLSACEWLGVDSTEFVLRQDLASQRAHRLRLVTGALVERAADSDRTALCARLNHLNQLRTELDALDSTGAQGRLRSP